MIKTCIGTIMLMCIAIASQAATSRIDGAQAKRLASILASGSKDVFDSLDKEHGVNIHEVRVLSQATYKFDADDSRYRVNRQQAWGKLNGSNVQSEIHEAIALWEFLTDLGFKPDLALEGSYLTLQQIDCRIDPKVDVADARRIVCVLTSTER